MLRPHLTPENHQTLLEAARGKSKRDVEYQIACLAPKVDAGSVLRRLPEPTLTADALPATKDMGALRREQPSHVEISAAVPAPRPTLAPLSHDRYLLRVTLSASAHGDLRRAQDLMRHTVPSGDPASIIERALAALVDQLERTKSAKTSSPRRGSITGEPSAESRHIPAAVKRAVWARDDGRCAFVGAKGRCTETGRLEYHHVVPFARGGPTDVENIALRCRAHNVFESDLLFGTWAPPVGELGPDRVEGPTRKH